MMSSSPVQLSSFGFLLGGRLLLSFLVSMSLNAQVVLNPGFEGSNLNDWTVTTSGTGGFNSNTLSNGFNVNAVTYPDGNVASDLGSRIAFGNTVLNTRDTITFTTAGFQNSGASPELIAANSELVFTVALGNRQESSGNFSRGADTTLRLGYLEVTGDHASFVALESVTLTQFDLFATTSPISIPDNGFADFGVTTLVGPGSPAIGKQLAIQLFFDQAGQNQPRQNIFDNVRISASEASDPGTDSDGDGLTNLEESALGTNPDLIDSDGDGLNDGAEVNTHNTDPLVSDSDGDSNPDGFEIAKGTDPNDALSKTDRPNIIFIFADDLGYGDIGVLFQNSKTGKKHKTPFLDEMAGDGLILDRHYCPAPVCAPSRSSLLTGLHQGHATVGDGQFDKAVEDNHSLATTLKAAGYATSIIGKWGLQGSGSNPATWEAYPTKRGYDYFFGYVRHQDGHNHYPFTDFGYRSDKELYDQDQNIQSDLSKAFTPDLFTARAKKLIADEVNDGDEEPFFLYLSYDTPHAALQIPTIEYPGENNSDDRDRSGLGLNGGVQWLGTSGNIINTATGTLDSYRHPDYTSAVGNTWTDAEERFATLVRRLDDNIGDLRQTLEDLGIADNTLIVLSSDNGPHAETYLTASDLSDGIAYRPTSFQSYGPFEGIKRDCWEGGIRVPTLVCWSNTVPASSISTLHSQLHDWLPTFCEIAGVPMPARTDGVSLLPTLVNPTAPVDQETPITYIEYNRNGSTPSYSDFPNHGGDLQRQAQVIFVDGYKGIRTNVTNHNANFEIYDTISDPAEATNLFLTPPAGQNAYFQELQQRMKDRVLQIRQPRATLGRPWDSVAIPAVGQTPGANGLNYQTFSGIWPWVPEFKEMTASSSGVISTSPDLSILPDTVQDDGILFEGFINIPTEGVWTFSLTTDSGSFLRIHEVKVVDNDFDHDGSQATGTARLAAGLHPISLYYTNDALVSPALNFTWQGPGVAQESVPVSALFLEEIAGPLPVANPDSVSTSASETTADAVVISPLDNDVDDGFPSSLSLASFTTPQNGSVVQNGNTLTYTPPVGFYGKESFSYTITDGENFAQSTVTVTTVYEADDLWLPFNECGGTAIHRATGLSVGSLSATVSRIAGRHGNALSFDGDASEFSLSGLTDLPSGASPRTIMAWVRVPAGESSEFQAIFGYGGSGNGQRYTLRLNGSAGENNPGTPYQGVRLEVQGGNIVGATPVDDGQWHHIAVVSYGAVENSQIYLDGVLDSIASFTNEPINTTAGTVPTLGGSNHDPDYNFLGDVDELRLYPQALTQAEIQQIYSATLQVFAAWHRQYFGDAALIGWELDDDGDTLNRLGEYAFGGNPRVSDYLSASPSMSYNTVTGKIDIYFRRRNTPTSHGLVYTVEASRDLLDWTTLTTSEISAMPLPGPDCLEEAYFTTDADSSLEPVQFSRIAVELNEPQR